LLDSLVPALLCLALHFFHLLLEFALSLGHVAHELLVRPRPETTAAAQVARAASHAGGASSL
jgi:hypothetical protein